MASSTIHDDFPATSPEDIEELRKRGGSTQERRDTEQKAAKNLAKEMGSSAQERRKNKEKEEREKAGKESAGKSNGQDFLKYDPEQFRTRTYDEDDWTYLWTGSLITQPGAGEGGLIPIF